MTLNGKVFAHCRLGLTLGDRLAENAEDQSASKNFSSGADSYSSGPS
jgi:hypothetical protein